MRSRSCRRASSRKRSRRRSTRRNSPPRNRLPRPRPRPTRKRPRLAAQQAAHQAAAAKAAPPPKPVAATAPPRTTGITRGAQIEKAAAAQYPLEAARNQTSGYAVVEFTVTATGSVTGAHVIESSPRRVFDQAAIHAVQQSTYKPALKDGEPVSTVLQRRVAFKFGG